MFLKCICFSDFVHWNNIFVNLHFRSSKWSTLCHTNHGRQVLNCAHFFFFFLSSNICFKMCMSLTNLLWFQQVNILTLESFQHFLFISSNVKFLFCFCSVIYWIQMKKSALNKFCECEKNYTQGLLSFFLIVRVSSCKTMFKEYFKLQHNV